VTQQNLAGRLIADRYLVQSLIARGGMSSVYLAMDERLERQVAIKVIYAHLAENPSFREKFIREAKTAARLNHPNLVNVFDQGQDQELTFLVMEYVPGMTLRDALKKFGRMSPARALDLFEPILQGLAAAHRGGILHRDLKPENVFLADDGRIKLGDFGLARNVDANTSTGSLIGTIAYLSPELITRGVADARSDVYAAGILLFELLTGEQPFKGDQVAHIAHQHTTMNIPSPSSLVSQVPPLLDEVVLWAAARAPEHRPANAQVLAEVVQRVRTEIKAGRGATTKLDLPEFQDVQATKVLSVEPTTVLDFPSSGSADATTAIADIGFDDETLGAQATSVLDDLGEPMSPIQSLAHSRRNRGKWAVTWILLFALLSSGAGWWFGSGPGGLSALPNLTSSQLTDAKAALAPYAPNITVKSESSATVSQGLVTRTEPAAGNLFWRGGTITIWVSTGAKLLSVPKLTGLSTLDAQSKLARAGFTLGTAAEYFNTATTGLVFDYLGSDGTPIPQGSAVDLKISLGPLPAVAGLDQPSAINALQKAGVKIGSISPEFSDAVSTGQVIRVQPQQDPLGKGGQVILVVSKGPNTVIMPSVVGETLLATKVTLENLGLQVRVNTDQLQSNWGLVKVKTASVAAGATLHVGDVVTISNR
jgi:serine/threonine protein kinase